MAKPLALLPLVGAGLGVAGSIASAAHTQSIINKQKQANEEWAAYQRAQQERFRKKERVDRKEATREFGDYARQNSQRARMATIDEEAGRLEDYLDSGKGAAALAQSDLVTAGDSGSLNRALGSELTEATRRARDNMRSRARAGAYGSSFGSMARQNKEAFMGAKRDIAGLNDRRRGYTVALKKYGEVEPLRYEMTPSPVGTVLSGLGSIFAGG